MSCPYVCEYPGCHFGAHKPKVNWNGDDTAILCASHIKSEIIEPLIEERDANESALSLMSSLAINPAIPYEFRSMMRTALGEPPLMPR